MQEEEKTTDNTIKIEFLEKRVLALQDELKSTDEEALSWEKAYDKTQKSLEGARKSLRAVMADSDVKRRKIKELELLMNDCANCASM